MIDPDKPLTDKEWESLGPVMRGIDELPPKAQAAVRKLVGRPKLAHPKQAVSLRIDADVLAAFRATGSGWQTRLNDTLRRHMPK